MLCFSSWKDKYVFYVDDHTWVQEISENCIYECVENSWCIDKTIRHDWIIIIILFVIWTLFGVFGYRKLLKLLWKVPCSHSKDTLHTFGSSLFPQVGVRLGPRLWLGVQDLLVRTILTSLWVWTTRTVWETKCHLSMSAKSVALHWGLVFSVFGHEYFSFSEWE